jgi:hypothetical protein
MKYFSMPDNVNFALKQRRKIRVESQPDEGSAFYSTLPV